MIFVRKKHWVNYHSDKCKLYLRTDFHYTCAYCGYKEFYTTAGEKEFEKDHFYAKSKEADWDVNSYENMVYSCTFCNGKKSDASITELIDPCKEDIYGGDTPHIRCLGESEKYTMEALTPEGQTFIDTLQLNSYFQRTLRKKMAQLDETYKLFKTMNIQTPLDMIDDVAFKCGTSDVGESLATMIEMLNAKGINCTLLLNNDDIDIQIIHNGKEYLCEFRVNSNNGTTVRSPRLDESKEKALIAQGYNNYGIIVYYKKMNKIILYEYGDSPKWRPIFLVQ